MERQEVEDLFARFGPLEEVKLKRGYGFVEFRDSKDASDAVDQLNGTTFHEESLSVEFSTSRPRPPREDRPPRRDRFPPRDRERNGDRDRRRQGPNYRVAVSNLSSDTSWQDLKDFARTANVDIAFTDVSRRRDGTGAIEFYSRDDMERALDSLDRQEYKGSVVSLREDRSRPPPRMRDDFRSRGGRREYDSYHRDRSRSRSRDRGGDYYRRDRRPPPRDRDYDRRDRDRDYRRRDDRRDRDRDDRDDRRDRRDYDDDLPPPPPPPPVGDDDRDRDYDRDGGDDRGERREFDREERPRDEPAYDDRRDNDREDREPRNDDRSPGGAADDVPEPSW